MINPFQRPEPTNEQVEIYNKAKDEFEHMSNDALISFMSEQVKKSKELHKLLNEVHLGIRAAQDIINIRSGFEPVGPVA